MLMLLGYIGVFNQEFQGGFAFIIIPAKSLWAGGICVSDKAFGINSTETQTYIPTHTPPPHRICQPTHTHTYSAPGHLHIQREKFI